MKSLPLSSHSTLLSKEELEALHRILRAEIRAYVDRRMMDEEAHMDPAISEAFAVFTAEHPAIAIATLADVLYRLTLGSVYNCFQFVKKSIRHPSNLAIASQLTTEIALQLHVIRNH